MERTVERGEKALIHVDGKPYFRSEYTVDFGPKNGKCRVEVLDPCVTQEAQAKRRAALVRLCQDLQRRGEVCFEEEQAPV